MKACCFALLFVLVCVCEADPELQMRLTLDNPEDLSSTIQKMVELSLNHHHDHETSDEEDTGLRGQLSALEMRLNVTESQLEEVKRHNADLQTRLAASENHQTNMTTTVQDLQTTTRENHVQDLQTNMEVLKTLVKVLVQDLQTNMTNTVQDLQTRLAASENHVQDLQTRLAASENLVQDLQTNTNTLQTVIRDQPKVAFSARYLGNGYIGPYSSTTTLVYQRVLTNIGNAYNTATGVFRAPRRGLYYFRFTAAAYGSSEYMGIEMFKNNQLLLHNVGYNDHIKYEYMSNAVVVEMEQGDTVDMRLWGGSGSGWRVYDNSQYHNTFTGFLLYAL